MAAVESAIGAVCELFAGIIALLATTETTED